MHKITITASIVFAALAAAGPAAAHVGISAPKSEAGGYALATLSVPHGCEGKATTKLEVKLPEGTTSATPARSSFWDAEVQDRKLDEPIDDGHGGELTEVPDVVVYTASTPLPDGELDLLPISLKLPGEEGRAFFPVIQTCEGDAVSEWTTPVEEGDEEAEKPAPFLTLTAGSGGHGGGDEAKDDSHDEGASDDDSGDEAEAVDEGRVNAALGLAIAAFVIAALGLFRSMRARTKS